MRVVVQCWLESERGWGVRPDGISVHLTEEDRISFIDEYWNQMPNHIPDEYSYPSSKTTTRECLDLELLAELEQSPKKGIWFLQHELKELTWLTS